MASRDKSRGGIGGRSGSEVGHVENIVIEIKIAQP